MEEPAGVEGDYMDQKLATKQQLITFHHILCRSKVKDVLQNVLKELKAALLCLLVVQLGLYFHFAYS